ncbi:MAG: ATP-binding cassette domain-containing protein [Pseudoruegeria sp.]
MFPLTLENATVRQRGKILVGPVNLVLDGPGVTIVIGPNGAGKTTFLRMLHGIAKQRSGTLKWACPEKVARARQAFVFQHPIMLRRSVLGNLIYPLCVSGVARKDAVKRAVEAADNVGLGTMLHRAAPQLSGGERQKLALARALISKPDVVFLDEPCASLDGCAIREIEAILRDAVAAGTRLIMSTHDLGQARRLATEVLFLFKGKVHEHSQAQIFFTHPQTLQADAFLKGDIVE